MWSTLVFFFSSLLPFYLASYDCGLSHNDESCSSQMIGEMEKDNIFPLSTIIIIVTFSNKSYVLPSSHHLNIFIHLRYDKYLIMLQASNPSATKYKQKPPSQYIYKMTRGDNRTGWIVIASDCVGFELV